MSSTRHGPEDWDRGSYLPQACRQIMARPAMAIQSTSSPAATACSCSRVLGTVPASMVSHSETVMPARPATSSADRPRASRAERIKLPKNSPVTRALIDVAGSAGKRVWKQHAHILITPERAFCQAGRLLK